VPKYCINCGAAYPWQQSAIDNLKEILKKSNLSPQDMEIIEATLPDVLRDTPKAESSPLKLKGVLAKVGKPIYDISVKVITDVASETARKILGLPLKTPSSPRFESAARADAEEDVSIYTILVRSTYFSRASRSAVMIEFV
jgi:hypothetical protein